MKTDFEGPARPAGAVAVGRASSPQETRVDGAAHRLPSITELASRCALPLVMGLVLLGTILWGGFVTFVMAFLLWKAAGAVL